MEGGPNESITGPSIRLKMHALRPRLNALRDTDAFICANLGKLPLLPRLQLRGITRFRTIRRVSRDFRKSAGRRTSGNSG